MLRNLCLALNNGLRQFIANLKNNKSVPASTENSPEFKDNPLLSVPIETHIAATDPEVISPLVEVDNKTIIGRRLLSGDFKWENNQPKILFQAFYDTRVSENLSLDALGYSGSHENKVINALRTIIKKHYELTSINYVAWAGIKKKTIHKDIKVFSTPDNNPENLNKYHCDLDRSNHRNIQAARSLAYELMNYANNDNIYIPVEPEKK